MSKRGFGLLTPFCHRKKLDAGVLILYNPPQMIPSGEKGGAARILVIDDEKVIRELLFDVLSRKDYIVDTAEDGFRGLEKAEATRYDVIFTDIRMPGINGLEVFKKLKQISPESRVIVMTGYGLEEMINEALTLGAFADVKKPFEISYIYELVGRALRNTGKKK